MLDDCGSNANFRPPPVDEALLDGMSGVLEVDGSSRYFFMSVTFTMGEEVRALPVEDGAGDNFTIVDCV